jgi:anti-anti-sigma regulatory factor
MMAETEETVTLKVEGRIIGEWVNEVRVECEMSLAKGRKVVLDLSGIIFIDQQGIEALNALRRNGVNLIRCSLFLSGLLQASSSSIIR